MNYSRSDILAILGCIAFVGAGVVTSAELGVAKPDPAIFARGLALAGVDAADALHVGDDLDALAGWEPEELSGDDSP